MKVLKFGGTSVGTIESLRNVKRIVESMDMPVIIVVSALGGLTDHLISIAGNAEKGTADLQKEMGKIRKRHHDIIDALVPDAKKTDVSDKVDILLKELENLYTGVSLLNELSPRTLDRIVAYGERMSSLIVADIIANCEHRDSLNFMKTEKWLGRNIADRPLTEAEIIRTFGNMDSPRYVMGGFISRDRDEGYVTNLGRGGSDYTAALVAAALNAEELQIWTDVDGFMTSDPRMVPNARVIPEMTFVESMELCSYGAKVIYPPTIYPVFHKNIPIKILNTHNPSAPGTNITDNAKSLPDSIRGVSMLRPTSVLTVKENGKLKIADINSRAGNAVAKAGISVLGIENPSDCKGYSISLPTGDASKALDQLKEEFAPEISDSSIAGIEVSDNKAVIAVVKEGIRKMEGLGARLINILNRNGIPVHGISDGASEATVAIVVDEDMAVEALRLIHEAVILTGDGNFT